MTDLTPFQKALLLVAARMGLTYKQAQVFPAFVRRSAEKVGMDKFDMLEKIGRFDVEGKAYIIGCLDKVAANWTKEVLTAYENPTKTKEIG